MPSSKGKPTDLKLREEAKEEVMQMEKGGGKGNWSAYKSAEMAKLYEKKGGGYEDQGDNPNEAKTGAPQPKKDAAEKGERKAADAPVGDKKPASKGKDDKPASKKEDASKSEEEEEGDDKKRKADKDDDGKKDDADKKPKQSKAKKEQKPPAQGTRSQPSRGAKK